MFTDDDVFAFEQMQVRSYNAERKNIEQLVYTDLRLCLKCYDSMKDIQRKFKSK